MEIFMANEVSHRYNNERRFDSSTLTQARHFENRASCVGYPDGQANCSTFQKKVHRRRDGRATVDMCCRLINVYQTHYQPSVASERSRSKE
jgi:hypothetical protein